MLNALSDIEKTEAILKQIVINKIEKEIDYFKSMSLLKDRQKYLESYIKANVSNFGSLRKLFSSSANDAFIEDNLMNLVSKESLEDIERAKAKRESPENAKIELISRNYETLRNDISSRLTMLEAYHAIDELINSSKKKIEECKKEKIECSLRIRDYHQEIYDRKHGKLEDQTSDATGDASPHHTALGKILISGSPRKVKTNKINILNYKAQTLKNQVFMDMTQINKARLNQLNEPFKAAADKVEIEMKNLEALRMKKIKLRNKLIDVYHFLLKNPQIVL